MTVVKDSGFVCDDHCHHRATLRVLIQSLKEKIATAAEGFGFQHKRESFSFL